MVLRWLRATAFGSVSLALASSPLTAATPAARPQAVSLSTFAISQPVRSLPEARPDPRETRPAIWEPENEKRPQKQSDQGDIDALVQRVQAELAMPAPIVSFEGGSNADNLAAFGFLLSPPDTNGAVGPNHYVQMVNLLARIFDKTGTPVTSFFKLSSLFAPLGGLCSTNDNGDPIVMYDRMADRWILSQFGFTNIHTPPYHECLAISQTGDPTGTYALYDFATPGNEFPDYPHLSVWPDAYYMTVHQFTNGGPFDGSGAYAFDRAKLIAGDPSATGIYFSLDLTFWPNGIYGILASTLDGYTAPAVGTPNTFMYPTATEFGDPSDAIRLFDFHADFETPANSTFTERPESPLAIAAFDPRDTGTRRDVEQPPPATATNAVDSLSGQLMYRVASRMLSGQGSYTLNFTVNVGGANPTTAATYQAGIRWLEFRRNPSTGAFSVFDQGTYAPTAPNPGTGENRWAGSIAQDNQGNIALGFSVSSTTIFPSVRYAGRLASDPPGTLPQGEATLIAGTGSQLTSSNRWGDYAEVTVDPTDDCTFWLAEEYYTATGQALSGVGWQTRIGSFKYPGCTAAPKGTLSGTITACSGGLPVAGALVAVQGGTVRTTDAGGHYSMDLAPSTYDVTVSAPGFNFALDTVTITNGSTTTSDACLTAPNPVAEPAALTVDAHLGTGTLSNLNGVIEPGESNVVIEPAWHNGTMSAFSLSGTASSFAGPGGGLYTIDHDTADYGNVPSAGTINCHDGTGDCYRMSVANPVTRPIGHWDATFDELVSDGSTQTWTLHIGSSFADVSPNVVVDPYYSFVETIFHNGVTAGCASGAYCPTLPNIRQEMAVFLLKASQGSSYAPPNCTGHFSDVPCPSLYANWIEDLSNRGITAGCQSNPPFTPPVYCPVAHVLRQEMAVFLLKTSQGSSYVPPNCTGHFSDVACPSLYANFIEDLSNRGITSGCQSDPPFSPPVYCPTSDVLRQEMAVFLTRTFGLVLYGP